MRRRATLRAALRAAVAVGLVLVGVACGGSEEGDEQAAAGAAPSTSTTSAAPPADRSAFCELLADTAGEVDESYLGSAEHRVQIDRLAAAAPDEVRPDVERFRDHVREFVDPDVPGSADMERYPDDVRTALGRIAEYQAQRC